MEIQNTTTNIQHLAVDLILKRINEIICRRDQALVEDDIIRFYRCTESLYSNLAPRLQKKGLEENLKSIRRNIDKIFADVKLITYSENHKNISVPKIDVQILYKRLIDINTELDLMMSYLPEYQIERGPYETQ